MGCRMRGKKADPVFISQFIQESVQSGVESPDQIVQRAKNMIEQIDEEIRSIEAKKITRSKLLDVISTFEKQVKDKTEEAKLLPLFGLEYSDECKEICEAIASMWIIEVDDSHNATHKYCIKQLTEQKIINRLGKNRFTKGDRFDDYMKFVLGQNVAEHK